MSDAENSNLVALSLVPGIGSLLARQLIAHFGSAQKVMAAPKGKLMRVPGIGDVLSTEIAKHATLEEGEKVVQDAKDKGLQLIGVTDPLFPPKLKEISDTPLYLYWQGNASPCVGRSIAIVGTRKATEYGRTVTERIVKELAEYNPTIVSGFAYGIDIIAHRAALANGLETLAVLGGGHGRIYPAEHKKYVNEVMANGAIVTEYAYNTEPDPKHFPARNRIVAGMVDAVIVVEAAESGGALITAELANSYNREVFAVPGNLTNKYSEGCNLLIGKHLAHIFTSVKEMVEMLGWTSEGKSVVASKSDLFASMSNTQSSLYALLKDQGEMHIDDLSWKSQMNMNQLAALLLEMELNGWVKPLPGKKFKVV